jgi:hypothetical protein
MATSTIRSATWVWASPEGALVLLAAIGTAAVASMPLVLLPGVLAYAILTYLRHRRAAGGEGTPAPYAARVHRAEALERRILAELEGAAPEHGALLAGTAERVRALVVATARLAEQLAELDRHLDEASISPERGYGGVAPIVIEDPGREARALEQRIAAARDPGARDGYARALAQLRQKEKVALELSARRERIDAQLVEIEKTLETTGAQVVRIKSAEGAAAGAEGARIAEALDALAVEVDAAAETVDEAAAYARVSRR